jgi:hypothetical protein
LSGFAGSQEFGSAGGMMPGAPQHTMPQSGGSPPANAKSGLIPAALMNVAASGLAMIQRCPATPLGTFAGTRSSTLAGLPGAQLKSVSRVFPTRFWPPASMRISTYWRLAVAPTPDMTSSMTAMWKAAKPGGP